MAANYHGKKFYTMVANLNTSVNYCIILALENVGTEVIGTIFQATSDDEI
jgi:hypothetical protein